MTNTYTDNKAYLDALYLAELQEAALNELLYRCLEEEIEEGKLYRAWLRATMSRAEAERLKDA